MKITILGAFVLLSMLINFPGAAGAAGVAEFPGRQDARYKNLKTIDIDTLHSDYLQHKAVIIDVRSALEFDTIHIKDSLHLALSDKSFADKLQIIAGRNQGKKIAFY